MSSRNRNPQTYREPRQTNGMAELFNSQRRSVDEAFTDDAYEDIAPNDQLPEVAGISDVYKDMRIQELEMDRDCLLKTLACARMVITSRSTTQYLDEQVNQILEFMWARADRNESMDFS